MSLDSNPNVNPDTPSRLLLKVCLAIGLALGLTLFLGATAWSAPRPGYSASEIRGAQTENEAKVQEIRDQEITQLKIALGRRIPENRRADLYLRLAEIHLESYRQTFLLEGRVHEKRLEKGIPDKFIDRGNSLPHLAQGIEACKAILKIGIRYDKMDQVYYFLGFNYGELGNKKESIHYYGLLTEKYPESPLVTEAYRELGDDAYDSQDYRKSQAYYELAMKRPVGDALPRLLHKLAWSYYRTKQYDRAVDTMKEAISKSGENNEKFLSLREEALRDLAVFMTETGRVDEALAYYQKVAKDKDYYPRVLERLAKQYERNVEPLKATQVYESLLRTTNDEEALFRTRAKLIDLDLRRGRFKEALVRLKDVKPVAAKEGDTQTAAQNLRAMIRRTATEHHERYRKDQSRADLEIAEDFYQAYLVHFLAKDDPRRETPEIQMYLADVKRELGKSREASELYRLVLDSKDKRYAKEAGALWTASLADAIKRQATKDGKPTGDEPSKLEKEFVAAADDLYESLGDTVEGREAAMKAAQVLAGYKKTQKDAEERSRTIIARSPKSAQAQTAARLLLQLESDRLVGTAPSPEASESLGATMKELRENAPLMAADKEAGGKLALQMSDLDQRLKVGTIASLEKEKDFAAAAKGYEEFARDATKRDLAEKAYSNAVSSYTKAGDSEGASRVIGAWVKRYPDSKGALESMRVSATQALIQGQFESSAALFERIGKNDTEALQTAARLYEGVGNAEQALTLWARVLAQKGLKDRSALLLQTARLQEANGRDGDAAKSYKACMAISSAREEAECGSRLADLYSRAQDTANARAMFKKVAALKQASPFVAYARFRIAEAMEKQARFEPMQLPDTQLKKAVNQRVEFLEPLSRAYNSAMQAGGPWGVAALDRLASWAFNFADEIDRIPPPAGAQPAAVAQFQKNLAGFSQPLRQKAVQTWSEAYRRASSDGLLSPVLPEISDKLADAHAAGVHRAQGFRGRFRLAGLPADGGADGRQVAYDRTRERLTKNVQDAAAWVDYGNLLWGDSKPLLARIAYDRSLALSRKNAPALNNRGVIAVNGSGEEDWYRAAEAQALFREALTHDEFFIAAKMNLAGLYNYYRVFTKARPLWNQVLVKNGAADAHDGLAVAQFGMGDPAAADVSFEKAQGAGAPAERFVKVYADAARAAGGQATAEKCLAKAHELDDNALAGFEKDALERLKRTCTLWQTLKK